MDVLTDYFAEHLDDSALGSPPPDRVLRMAPMSRRYVLFRVGRLRFALPSTDIAALTRDPDPACEYLSAAVIVPARYQSVATPDDDHDTYIHLVGTRFGLGPCCPEGDVVLTADDIAACSDVAAWIAGTIAAPPSLVLDRDGLSAQLLAAAQA